MAFAIMLAFISCGGATLLTYLYLREAIFPVRICAGIGSGLASLGLVGFVLASFLGIRPASFALIVIMSLPFLFLRQTAFRKRVTIDIYDSLNLVRRATNELSWDLTGTLIFYLGVATVVWQLCDRAMFENVQGVFTGLDTNLGDLPFHLSVITSFAHGQNFPPQHPEFAGVPITYPFIVDFVTALFVSAGASIRTAFVWQNFFMMLALFVLIHNWAQQLLRDRLAALLTPLLVFLSGGFGWWIFLKESARGQGMFDQLSRLTHDYSIGLPGYRWGNALTALFVPQRGILLGMGLAVIVMTLWLQAQQEFDDDEEPHRTSISFRFNALLELLTATRSRSMIAAGTIAGLLPLVHAHSFVVIVGIAGILALLQLVWSRGAVETSTENLKVVADHWIPFFLMAGLLGIPQMLWATLGSAVQSGSFIGWEFGWDHGAENVIWFWLKNTALFIPLLLVAFIWNRYVRFIPARTLRFCLPFILFFILANTVRLAPWVWDNIKVLIYSWLALAPIVALVLAKLLRKGGGIRAAALALVIIQTAAGGLDVWRAMSGTVERQTFNTTAIDFARLVQQTTTPQSLILHAPTYNDPIYLTGRRTFVGYPGHLWSHGLDFNARLNELKTIYSGAADAANLLSRNRIDYVVVGPLEEAELKNAGVILNRNFFERFQKVGEVGEYRLYKTSQP